MSLTRNITLNGGISAMITMAKWQQAQWVAYRKHMSSSICTVPPPVAYDSGGCLWQVSPHVSSMSLPKPSLSINYGRDEIRVMQPFVSPSQGDPAQSKICCYFLFLTQQKKEERNRKRRKEVKQTEQPLAHYVTEERKCKVTEAGGLH